MVASKDAVDVTGLKCPLCNNSLTRDDYQMAKREMEKQANSRAEDRLKAEAESHRSRLEEMQEDHKNSLARQREDLQATHNNFIEDVKRDRNAQIQDIKKEHGQKEAKARREADAKARKLRAELEKAAKESARELKSQERSMRQAHAAEISARDKKLKSMEKSIHSQYSRDLTEKAQQIRKLEQEINRVEKAAESRARTAMNGEIEMQKKIHMGEISTRDLKIQEKNTQLERAGKELDDMKRKLEQSQPELRGEAGERDLRNRLTEAFPDDHIKRQKRGTVSSDLIQHIRLPSGKFGMPIVYDNKAGGTYTKADIKKAAGYKRTHGTEYSLIVSANPMKRTVPNGLLWEVDGVIVVHPSIVVEVARTIREGIVKIARMDASQHDQRMPNSLGYTST